LPRILVTGGAGFIGSHLVDRLLRDGHTVTVVDDLSTGRHANLAAAKALAPHRLMFVRADVTGGLVDDVVARAKPDVVHHLAAQMDVRRSVADPLHDARVNVLGTIRLLEACRRHGVRKMIVATSGGCIYGEPDPATLPVDEEHAALPHSPYGASKLATESYLHVYGAIHGLSWTSLALGNVYGPRQDPRGEAGVVSIFAGRMLAGLPVTIYGDGEQTRDFVHVEDVVEAFVAAMDGAERLRCNIGTQSETSVNELFDVLARLCGYLDEPRYAPARAGELQRIALDVSRARQTLGWRPRVDLERGLASVVEWLRASTRVAGGTPDQAVGRA
jgi:UDP-glucose 4-epimerase